MCIQFTLAHGPRPRISHGVYSYACHDLCTNLASLCRTKRGPSLLIISNKPFSRLTLLSLPLLFFPRILSLIFASFLVDAPLSAPIVSGGSSAGYDQLQQQHQQQSKQALRQLNTLETSLAALAGISLVSFASLLMLQSGVIPIVASSITSDPTKQQANVAPYRLPTAIITTLLMTGLSFGAWQLGMWVVVLASGGLAMWGGFVVSCRFL